jgi:hypothetical protein
VIEANREEFPISLMCRVLGVSRSGFYEAQKPEARQRERADQRLLLEIRSIHRSSKRRYGSPRVHAELKAQGVRCAKKRVDKKRGKLIFAELPQALIGEGRHLNADDAFGLERRVCALDSTTLDRCLSVFPWARFRTTKGVVNARFAQQHLLLSAHRATARARCACARCAEPRRRRAVVCLTVAPCTSSSRISPAGVQPAWSIAKRCTIACADSRPGQTDQQSASNNWG